MAARDSTSANCGHGTCRYAISARSYDAAGGPGSPAREVVDAIAAAGGEAVAHGGDIATAEGAASLVTTALDAFGRFDTLVNNAGFLRDRMLVNLDEDDWDAVVRVHLKGHFLPLRHAAAHWRAEAKAGRPPAARVINTSSGAGLLGSVGQSNYAAAKAGIVALTLVAAAELGRYGIQVNALAPAARTRMTERTVSPTQWGPPAPRGKTQRPPPRAPPGGGRCVTPPPGGGWGGAPAALEDDALSLEGCDRAT
ncbi:SDR family NAD(P)-dependent oxidoreductase, partial [Streptomyces californicus]|uniref:SDR family NAD(P)-dependent oxidoreductase n=1 Tax=Streptomyces californicus TaxID=67351 RepID=UPI0036BBF7DD